jgi:hypothetical protein
MSSKKEIEVPTEHPMEDVFGIEKGTTMVPKTVVKGDLKPHETYDDKDNEIDRQFQEVYDLALGAFDEQQEAAEVIDPKFKARTAEVAAQFLTTALNAAQSKMQLKQQREKLEISKGRLAGGVVNNGNMIITDRNSLLKLMEEDDDFDEAIDGDYEET